MKVDGPGVPTWINPAYVAMIDVRMISGGWSVEVVLATSPPRRVTVAEFRVPEEGHYRALSMAEHLAGWLAAYFKLDGVIPASLLGR